MHVLRRFREALRPGGLILDLQVIRPNPLVEVDGEDICEIDGSPLFATAESRCRRDRRDGRGGPPRRGRARRPRRQKALRLRRRARQRLRRLTARPARRMDPQAPRAREAVCCAGALPYAQAPQARLGRRERRLSDVAKARRGDRPCLDRRLLVGHRRRTQEVTPEVQNPGEELLAKAAVKRGLHLR